MGTVLVCAARSATDIICQGESSPGITVPKLPDPNKRVPLVSRTRRIPPS